MLIINDSFEFYRRKVNMIRVNVIRFLSHRLCFLSKNIEIHL